MDSHAKVLVVDDGDRSSVDPLSSELAELGVSSVTTSLEAAHEVLGMVATPTAIVLRMPRSRTTEYHAFLVLADQLRRGPLTGNIPLILWDDTHAAAHGGLAAVLGLESLPPVEVARAAL